MKLIAYDESRVGGRPYNQDRCGACYKKECSLLVLADGMGGIKNGEIAAQIVVDRLLKHFNGLAKPRIDHPNRFLINAVTTAHHAIVEYASFHQLSETPSTTVVAAIIQDNTLYWCHVGDSRLYLFDRKEGVVLRSRDHSQIQRMIDQGFISADAIKEHPDKSKIYNCLGALHDPEVEVGAKTALAPGQSLILCSDGLWDHFEDNELEKAFSLKDVSVAVPVLMNIAERRGRGRGDNLSVVSFTLLADKDISRASSPYYVDTSMLPDDSNPQQRQIQQRAEEDIIMELNHELNSQEAFEAIKKAQQGIR